MRVIIAGSRTVTDVRIIERAVKLSGYTVTTVVSGTCRGVDRLGEAWAEANGIPIDPQPADWIQYGHLAGPLRNGRMVDLADALIAILNADQDSGTLDVIRKAMLAGLPHQVFEAATLI